jgi:hypothetical protein
MPHAKIENLSLGASPGVQFSSVMHMDFTSFNYVIFDSVPNDEEYTFNCSGYSDERFTSRIIFEICSTIASDTKLIILGIPTKKHLYKESSIYSNRRKIAQLCGAQFIDFRSILLNNAQAFYLNIAISDLYDSHPAHPHPKIMFSIGRALSETLISNPITGFKHSSKCYRSRYQTIDASSLGMGLAVNKQNSLVSECFAELQENDYLEFDKTRLCIGFYLNHCATNATVEITAENGVSKLNLSNNRLSERLLKVFVALPDGRATRRITVLPPAKITDHNHNPVIFSKSSLSGPGKLQISKIVFLNDTSTESLPVLDDDFDCTILHKLVTGVLNSTPNHPETRGRTANIKNSSNQFLFYNLKLNKVVSIDSKYVSLQGSELHPITIEESCGKIRIFAIIGSSRFQLSFYPQRISIGNSNILGITLSEAPPLGSEATALLNQDNSFSLSCSGFYLFSAPNHDVACNRKEAKRCEKFFFED